MTVPGFPDGIKVDDAGRVYASAYSGVQVFDPGGEQLGEIHLPGAVNFTFGGPARNAGVHHHRHRDLGGRTTSTRSVRNMPMIRMRASTMTTPGGGSWLRPTPSCGCPPAGSVSPGNGSRSPCLSGWAILRSTP